MTCIFCSPPPHLLQDSSDGSGVAAGAAAERWLGEFGRLLHQTMDGQLDAIGKVVAEWRRAALGDQSARRISFRDRHSQPSWCIMRRGFVLIVPRFSRLMGDRGCLQGPRSIGPAGAAPE